MSTGDVTIVRDGRGYRLSTELRVPETKARVFAFFSDAFQLERITPPWLHFSVRTAPPIVIEEGTLIDYKLRLRGIPIRWQSRISVWKPNDRFVDEQIVGPYRYWYHEHTFESEGDATRIRDQVRYAVPGGFLTHQLFVRHQLIQIFRFRRAEVTRRLTKTDDASRT